MTEGAPSYLGAFKTAEDVSGYSKLWYTRNGKCSQAFIIKACSTGFLLCLPQGAISEEELDQAILTEYQDVLGPWTTPSVVAVGVHGRELKKTLPVLIVDVQASEIAAVAEEPVYGTERLSFGTVRLQSVHSGPPGDAGRPGRSAYNSGTASRATSQQHLASDSRGRSPNLGASKFSATGARPSWNGPDSATSGFCRARPSDFGCSSQSQSIFPLIPLPPHPHAEDDDEAEPEADVREGGMLAKLFTQQTKILGQLASSSRKQADPLQNLLGGGGSNEEDPEVPGVRGMAARQPLKVRAKVRERLATARRKDVSSLEPRDMYLHFQETVPWGSFKTLTYFAFLLAECWEAAEKGQAQDMVALVALGLVFAEQVANEQGHTRLGWLLTGRADPPFAPVEQRKAPEVRGPPRHVGRSTVGDCKSSLPSRCRPDHRTQKIRPKVVAGEESAT